METTLAEYGKTVGRAAFWDEMRLLASSFMVAFVGSTTLFLLDALSPSLEIRIASMVIATGLAIGFPLLFTQKKFNRWRRLASSQSKEVKGSYGLPDDLFLPKRMPREEGERAISIREVGNHSEAYTFVRTEGEIKVYGPEGNEFNPSGKLAEPKVASAPKPIVYAENEQLWQTASGGK